jgi:hypothetical protein
MVVDEGFLTLSIEAQAGAIAFPPATSINVCDLVGILDLKFVLLFWADIGVFSGQERIPPIGDGWPQYSLGAAYSAASSAAPFLFAILLSPF